MRRKGWVALAAVLLGGSADPGVESELKTIEGPWRFVAIRSQGKEVPDESFKDSKLMLKGGVLTTMVPGYTDLGGFKIDPSASPKAIDITLNEGLRQKITYFGIYENKGDTLRVCFGLEGKPRPTEFESKPQGGRILEVLTREAP
ncbi:TIGR03067 domain-containing protein [Singulisphaera rosea]